MNEFFGEYGIVIVDGDDKEFKKQFVNEFKSDIFDHRPFEKISSASKALKDIGYYAQVNGRQINCFYLEKGLRTRIERDNENFKVVDTDLIFTKKQLEKIIETAPEKISPNVILRPVYQQKILPNLAYVGGPGELAYWLELKEIFDSEKVVYPILIPRNFFTVVEKNIGQKIDKLKILEGDLFTGETELIKNWQTVSNNLFALSGEESDIRKIYDGIIAKLKPVDQSLTGKVAAEQQKAINGLESIVLKTNRAIRRKSETEINQLKLIKQYFSPAGVPQERYENFSRFYLLYGSEFFSEIKKAADPFTFKMVLFREG